MLKRTDIQSILIVGAALASYQPCFAQTLPIVSVPAIEKVAEQCSIKISAEQYDVPEYESEGSVPTIMITIFKDNSPEALKCFNERVPNVVSSKVERRSDAKIISSDDIDTIKKECNWEPEDGDITFFDDGSLTFRPSPTTNYDKVDCALGKIRTFSVPKFGFVGNEAYQEGEAPK